MAEEADTQALLWLRALQKNLRDVEKNAEYCIRGQAAGKLSQEDFDEFVEKVNRFAKRVIKSTTGESAAP